MGASQALTDTLTLPGNLITGVSGSRPRCRCAQRL